VPEDGGKPSGLESIKLHPPFVWGECCSYRSDLLQRKRCFCPRPVLSEAAGWLQKSAEHKLLLHRVGTAGVRVVSPQPSLGGRQWGELSWQSSGSASEEFAFSHRQKYVHSKYFIFSSFPLKGKS